MVEGKRLGILIVGFILLITGIVLLDVLADSTSAATTLSVLTGESIVMSSTDVTVTNETFVFAVNNNITDNIPLVNVTFFGNTSISTNDVSIVFGEDVNFTRRGTVTVNPANFSAGLTYNISYIYETALNGSTTNADVTSLQFFGNGTVNTTSGGITIDTDVNVTRAGLVTANILNFTAATYTIDYTFEGSEYVVDATSRVLVNLLPLFFVLGGVFFVAIGLSLDMGIREFINNRR